MRRIFGLTLLVLCSFVGMLFLSAQATFLPLIGAAGSAFNPVTSASPVTTSGGSTTNDQLMMELALPANFLNFATQPTEFFAAGVYTLPSGQTPQLTVKIKLCTVSGCGSGTVVTLVSIQTAAATASVTNLPWNLRTTGLTVATGASGTLEIHGSVIADIGSLTTSSDTVYNDTNTTVSSTINLTGPLYVDFTFAFSSSSSSNVATQRAGAVIPF